METTKITKYCKVAGCREPLKSISFADEENEDALRNDILRSYLQLREAVENCNHGKVTASRFKAPKGRYRVIGVDTFEGPTADYPLGIFRSKEDAIAKAAKEGGEMNKTYVYDDTGLLIAEYGTF